MPHVDIRIKLAPGGAGAGAASSGAGVTTIPTPAVPFTTSASVVGIGSLGKWQLREGIHPWTKIAENEDWAQRLFLLASRKVTATAGRGVGMGPADRRTDLAFDSTKQRTLTLFVQTWTECKTRLLFSFCSLDLVNLDKVEELKHLVVRVLGHSGSGSVSSRSQTSTEEDQSSPYVVTSDHTIQWP